jgi:hypothetical protein
MPDLFIQHHRRSGQKLRLSREAKNPLPRATRNSRLLTSHILLLPSFGTSSVLSVENDRRGTVRARLHAGWLERCSNRFSGPLARWISITLIQNFGANIIPFGVSSARHCNDIVMIARSVRIITEQNGSDRRIWKELKRVVK